MNILATIAGWLGISMTLVVPEDTHHCVIKVSNERTWQQAFYDLSNQMKPLQERERNLRLMANHWKQRGQRAEQRVKELEINKLIECND